MFLKNHFKAFLWIIFSLLFYYLSRWFHTASITLRFGLNGDKSMTDGVPLYSSIIFIFFIFFLSKYAFCCTGSLLGSQPCWKTKLSPIRWFPYHIAWWNKIRLCFHVFLIPSVLIKTLTTLADMQPQNLAEPLQSVWLFYLYDCFHTPWGWFEQKKSHTWIYYSVRPFGATHFQFTSCFIWHCSDFSPLP